MPPKRKPPAASSQSSQGRVKVARTTSGSALSSSRALRDDHADARRSDSRPYNVQRFALQRNDSQPDACTGNLTLSISDLDIRPHVMASHSLSADSIMTLKQSGNDVAVVHAGELTEAVLSKRLASDNLLIWLQNNKLQLKYPDFKGSRQVGSTGLSIMFQLNGDALEVYELLKRAGFSDGPASSRPQSRADIQAIARAQSSNRALSRDFEAMQPLSAFGDRFGTGSSSRQYHTSAASIEDNMNQHFINSNQSPFEPLYRPKLSTSEYPSDPYTVPSWPADPYRAAAEPRPVTAGPDFYRAYNPAAATVRPPSSPLRREFDSEDLDDAPPPRNLPFQHTRNRPAAATEQGGQRPLTPGSASLLNAQPLPRPHYSPSKSSTADSACQFGGLSPTKKTFEVGPRTSYVSPESDPLSYPLSARGLNRARAMPHSSATEDGENVASLRTKSPNMRTSPTAAQHKEPLATINDNLRPLATAKNDRNEREEVKNWLKLPKEERERQMHHWWDTFDQENDPEWQVLEETFTYARKRALGPA